MKTMNSLLIWSFCVNVLIYTNVCIPLGMFYPYGSSNGDSRLSKSDDGSSNEVYISTAFPFFNHSERLRFVSINTDYHKDHYTHVVVLLATMETNIKC